jgi:uncharacterized protein (TIGR01777 family)
MPARPALAAVERACRCARYTYGVSIKQHGQVTLTGEQPAESARSETPTAGRVLVTGSSGFLGRPLCDELERRGFTVIRLLRDRRRGGVNTGYWDPQEGVLACRLLEGLSAVVHLSGESIAGRWTRAKRRRIYDSRILSTSLLCRTLATLSQPPRVLVSSSGTGYYGDRGDDPLTEEAPPGNGYFADLCRQWEAETAPAAAAGVRVVNVRSGLVLGESGGALKTMLPIFRLGLGGVLGSGEQYWPWISLTDQLRALLFCLEQERLRGPVNLCTPNPVTNREFTAALAQALGMPAALKVPAWALKAALGGLADEALLASQRAEPVKLRQQGFTFEHEELLPLLQQLLRNRQ